MKRKGKRPFDALVFDMDGTLTDSEPLHLLAYQQVLAGFAVTFSEEQYDQFTGATDKAIATWLVKTHSLPSSVDELIALKEAQFVELVRQRSVLRPGVQRVLQQASDAGLTLAVASSAMKGSIEAVLDCLKIRHYFAAIASGEEVKNSKPAPDVFKLAARRIKVRPRRCLAFEDSRNGTLAAKAAGMRCVVVPAGSTSHQDHSQADLQLASFEEIEDLSRFVARFVS